MVITSELYHLFADVSDKQLEEAYITSDGSLAMPAVGDLVTVVVTAIQSVTKFYVQLPLGNKSALAKQGKVTCVVRIYLTSNPVL